MGYMRHHAIIVTSFDERLIAKARAEAMSLDMSCTEVIRTAINGYESFIVGPDGSKEGWADSDEGDKRRDSFVAWLEATRYEDGSSALDWCEVQYGDGDGDNRVTRHEAQGEDGPCRLVRGR